MRPFFHIAVFALLIAVAPSQCLALRSVGIITKEEAKKLGIELRATPAGPDAAWLELEFKPTGKLKDFAHVEFEIVEGEKQQIAYLELSGQRTDKGTVKVRFVARREFFDKITLVLVTGFPGNYAANELRMKDFVALRNLR
jgi:hypothetical protein